MCVYARVSVYVCVCLYRYIHLVACHRWRVVLLLLFRLLCTLTPWLLLAMLSAAGVSIRHVFNLKHFGIIRHDFLFYGFMLAFGASIVATEVRPKGAEAPKGPVAFSTVQALVQKHCVMCHSPSPSHKGFTAPPNGVVFDTPEHIVQYAPKMYERAVASTSMPMGNETGMTDVERATLGAWIKAGARTQ